ncbi:DUF397 domain-containing protein [Streptomyces sp. NPDC088812]|uniref:DUF397 domain-containing protein n=1 Tax=Streptomyces sp. NPDC088812 TaxID=3365905 RepID=UPI0037F9C03D
MPSVTWTKSSFSEAAGNACVEIAAPSPDGVAVRESESPARVLTTGRAALGALIGGVKAGLDRSVASSARACPPSRSSTTAR